MKKKDVSITFEGGPLDSPANPLRVIQVFATDATKTKENFDRQQKREFHGSYELEYSKNDEHVYVWKGAKK